MLSLGAFNTYGGDERRGNLRERDNLVDPGMDGRIIFRWFWMNLIGVAWTGLIWITTWTGSVLL